MLTVDRAQVLAHRVATQGLLRDRPPERVLRLGVQHAGPSVALALAARTPVGPAAPVEPADTMTAWTHRGAPHRYRRADLVAAAGAALPFDDALATVVTEPMTKGAVSTAVTRLLPDPLLRDCKPCGVVHVNEQLMRLAAVPAGVALDPSGTTLLLVPGAWNRPRAPDTDAAAGLVEAYLRVLGPATDRQVAEFVGTSVTAFAPALEAARDGLEEVEVTGVGRARLPPDDVAALASPPEPDAVRLLPPYDPLVQARDRELLIEDVALRKEVYRAIGNPGTVLVDGEIVGTWRPRASGTRLALHVSTAAPLPPDARSRLDDEAERVAVARGLTLAGVTGG